MSERESITGRSSSWLAKQSPRSRWTTTIPRGVAEHQSRAARAGPNRRTRRVGTFGPVVVARFGEDCPVSVAAGRCPVRIRFLAVVAATLTLLLGTGTAALAAPRYRCRAGESTWRPPRLGSEYAPGTSQQRQKRGNLRRTGLRRQGRRSPLDEFDGSVLRALRVIDAQQHREEWWSSSATGVTALPTIDRYRPVIDSRSDMERTPEQVARAGTDAPWLDAPLGRPSLDNTYPPVTLLHLILYAGHPPWRTPRVAGDPDCHRRRPEGNFTGTVTVAR